MPNLIPTASRLLVAERDGRRCFRCGGARHLHWHHRRTRRVHDDHAHCPCNGISLCPTCHAWVHANPRLAEENGWLLSRYTTKPFMHHTQHFQYSGVVLDCDGTMRLEEE